MVLQEIMFDPPDFPYRDLADTLNIHYSSDDLIFNNDVDTNYRASNGNKDLATITEEMISNVANHLTFHSNDDGQYFNIDNLTYIEQNDNLNPNTELFIVQSDNIYNYESNLLDENTVNQFLLPLKSTSSEKKDTEASEPNLLALHTCVICNQIFTNDADLLDHTISVHASLDLHENNLLTEVTDNSKPVTTRLEETTNNALDFESDWLICSICERVLSTALEIEPNEQLCCTDGSGKGSVSSRKLHTMYVCDYCNGLFADGEALDRHRLMCFAPETPNQYSDKLVNDESNIPSNANYSEVCFSCENCNKQYSSTEELKNHTYVCQRLKMSKPKNERRVYSNNNNNKMWNCGSCNQLFATARELYRHKRGEDRPAGAPLMAYVCEECDKVLGSMCALHTHKKMHKVTKPGYPCRVCGRRFNQSGHLAIHMRMHTGERPYPCDLCPKAFKVKVERDDHRRTHTGERPFACTACPKTFTAAARLREHARIHTDQRPYRCDICGAAFRRPYARTVHTLIHTGEKPHECDVCGTAFRRSGDMWKHKRTLHGAQSGQP